MHSCRPPDISNQWEYNLESTILKSTKGFLSTFKLRTTAEDYMEPLKDDKQSSEMIHISFRRISLDAEYINCLEGDQEKKQEHKFRGNQ